MFQEKCTASWSSRKALDSMIDSVWKVYRSHEWLRTIAKDDIASSGVYMGELSSNSDVG
jgi:hypothetical protein